MTETIFDLIVKITGLLAGIVTILGFPALYRAFRIKDETLFGEEAKDRFESIEKSLPEGQKFGPYKYGGGEIKTPKLEVRKVVYDAQTMGREWKGVKKNLRYFYDDNGEKMIKGWRLKK